MLDAFPDPSVLDGDVRARLPLLGRGARALHLCHNQSGLRDYWAVAMLHGSPAEAPSATRGRPGHRRHRSLHFAPGTRYSYVNQNFRMLSDILQDHTGRSFAELLRTRIFERAGMDSAFLAADTRAMPDGTEGYEGTSASGFRAAENRILWTGDAGLGASLDDMIAWERHIDATRDDPDALLSPPLRAGRPSPMARRRPMASASAGPTEFGRAVIGHGGALRGWRSHRLYVPSERVSVVVHVQPMSDAHGAAMELLGRRAGRGAAGPARGCRRPPGSAPIGAGDRPGGAHRRGAGGQCGCATAISPNCSTCSRRQRHRRPTRLRAAEAAADGTAAREQSARCGPAREAGRATSPAAIAARNWMPN